MEFLHVEQHGFIIHAVGDWGRRGLVHEIELFVFLLFVVVVLVGFVMCLQVLYFVVFVLGGLVLGLVFGLLFPCLDFDFVFFVFLLLLLYSVGVVVLAYELCVNVVPIVWFAIGFVLVTIVVVAVVAYFVFGVLW